MKCTEPQEWEWKGLHKPEETGDEGHKPPSRRGSGEGCWLCMHDRGGKVGLQKCLKQRVAHGGCMRNRGMQ